MRRLNDFSDDELYTTFKMIEVISMAILKCLLPFTVGMLANIVFQLHRGVFSKASLIVIIILIVLINAIMIARKVCEAYYDCLLKGDRKNACWIDWDFIK